jgi:hypothetical protein
MINASTNGITYGWQKKLLRAYLSKPETLSVKIATAERAIRARLASGDFSVDEGVALEDAQRALSVLRRELEE